MGAANGFVTTKPDTQYGDVAGYFVNTEIWGQKFNCGGSGTQNIDSIGVWCYETDAGDCYCHLAIFTDDAANACPETIIANSDSGALLVPTSMGQLNYDYSTKPQVTGGVDYWFCSTSNHKMYYSRFNATNVIKYKTEQTYPNFPSGDNWHSPASIASRDSSLYAVYSAAAAGTLPIPQPLSRPFSGPFRGV
jgi:hypothetical protein